MLKMTKNLQFSFCHFLLFFPPIFGHISQPCSVPWKPVSHCYCSYWLRRYKLLSLIFKIALVSLKGDKCLLAFFVHPLSEHRCCLKAEIQNWNWEPESIPELHLVFSKYFVFNFFFFLLCKVQPCLFWFPWFPYCFAVRQIILAFFSWQKTSIRQSLSSSVSFDCWFSSQGNFNLVFKYAGNISSWSGFLIQTAPLLLSSKWPLRMAFMYSINFNLGGKVVSIDKINVRFESSQGLF